MLQLFKPYMDYLIATPVVLYGLLFVLGLIVGSFLNVCIYRLPDEEKSVVKPASYCPHCKTPIKWYDNIPVLGYLFLSGKCRACQEPISPRYMCVEIFTGILFVVIALYMGITVYSAFMVYFLCALFVGSVIDFQHRIIPDEITCYGMLVGLVMSFLFPEIQGEIDPRLGIANSILGLLTGGAIIYILAVVGSWVFRKEAMGGGDIKLLAMIGACVGVKVTVIGFLLSPYFAILFALYYKFFKKEEHVPYGPFLSIGAITALFFGEQLLSAIGM